MLFEIRKLWRADSNNVSIEISPKIYLKIPKEILLEIWLNGHFSMQILLEMALQSFCNETMLVQYIVKVMKNLIAIC